MKKPRRFKAHIHLVTKGKAPDFDTLLSRLVPQRFDVRIESTHDVDGSPAGECVMPADSVQVRHVGPVSERPGGKYELARVLRELADEVSNTDNDFDGGRSVVIVMRNYSDSSRKRLRGGPKS